MQDKTHIRIPDALAVLPRRTGCYLVGGTVRDLLLGNVPTDYDIAVPGDPRQFAAAVARRNGGRMVVLGTPGRCTYRVAGGTVPIDITGLADGRIHNDLCLRDLTINAMAVDLASGAVVDRLGGRADLRQKTIRMVSKEALATDPVRLLRIFRFAAALDFQVHPDTLTAVERYAPMLGSAAGERMRAEFNALLATARAAVWLPVMSACGLLCTMLPQWTANAHNFSFIAHLEAGHAFPPRMTVPMATSTSRRTKTAPPAAVALKYAALLHHADRPEHIARACRRLRLSATEHRIIQQLVVGLSRLLGLYPPENEAPGDRHRRTVFFMKTGELTPALLDLAVAHGAPDDEGASVRFLAFVGQVRDQYHNQYLPRATQPPLLTGHDLAALFHLPPCPLTGKILTAVETARRNGDLNTRHDALAMAQTLIPPRRPVP